MKTHLEAEGFDVSAELDKYATHKLAHLARAIPRKQKPDANCVVRFTQKTVKGTKYCTCAITLTVHGTDLKAEETTQHMYAALDIATVHIEQQLQTYAEHALKPPVRTRLKRRFGG